MIFSFPPLSGPHSVGLTTHYIVDQTRQDLQEPARKRELMLHIWYPAQPFDHVPCVAYDTQDSKLMLKNMGLPEADLVDLDSARTSAVFDAKPLQKQAPFPTLIFSHGFHSSTPSMYTAMCEDIASHGYMIVSIAHTDYASSVTFADGRTVCGITRMPTGADQPIWIADVKAVLEALPQINADVHDRLCNMFDLDRIGMFGHSFGGSTAFQLCFTDTRVKAGISLDGVLFGEHRVIDAMQKPFMFIVAQGCVDYSEKHRPEDLAEKYGLDVESLKDNTKRYKDVYQGFTPTARLQRVIIQDLQHGGFTDFVLLKHLPVCQNNKSIIDLDAYMGSGDGFALMGQITHEIVNFFNTYL